MLKTFLDRKKIITNEYNLVTFIATILLNKKVMVTEKVNQRIDAYKPCFHDIISNLKIDNS